MPVAIKPERIIHPRNLGGWVVYLAVFGVSGASLRSLGIFGLFLGAVPATLWACLVADRPG